MSHAADTTAEDMRILLQEGLIMRQYRHQGLRASSSAVHGTGCFAVHGFATGQFVCDYFGDLVPRSIGTRGRDQVAEGIFGLNESYQVDPRRRCTAHAQHTHSTRAAHAQHKHSTRTAQAQHTRSTRAAHVQHTDGTRAVHTYSTRTVHARHTHGPRTAHARHAQGTRRRHAH